MLVHECTECKALSINRIAADDDSQTVIAIFQESIQLAHRIHILCQEYGIVLLKAKDTKIVYTQLYGRQAVIPMLSWT